MDNSTQTESIKKSKSLYSNLIEEFNVNPNYTDRKKIAYQQTSIKFFDKIIYFKKSYIIPENLLNLPITTEFELIAKYDSIKKHVDNLKLERLKNGKNETNQRIKYKKKIF